MSITYLSTSKKELPMKEEHPSFQELRKYIRKLKRPYAEIEDILSDILKVSRGNVHMRYPSYAEEMVKNLTKAHNILAEIVKNGENFLNEDLKPDTEE